MIAEAQQKRWLQNSAAESLRGTPCHFELKPSGQNPRLPVVPIHMAMNDKFPGYRVIDESSYVQYLYIVLEINTMLARFNCIICHNISYLEDGYNTVPHHFSGSLPFASRHKRAWD